MTHHIAEARITFSRYLNGVLTGSPARKLETTLPEKHIRILRNQLPKTCFLEKWFSTKKNLKAHLAEGNQSNQ